MFILEKIFEYYFVYYLLFFILFQHSMVNTKSFSEYCSEMKETSNDIYQYLQIYTVKEFYVDQNILEERNSILNNCDIEENWNLNTFNSFYQNVDKIYENELIGRRSFRIKLMKNNISKPVVINSIKLLDNKISQLTFHKLPFILNSGYSFDFFIDYNCGNMNKWIDFKMSILIEDLTVEFNYIKICSKQIGFFTNFTYFVLVLLFILLTFSCEKDYLIFNVHIIKINPEEIIDMKYAEHITIYFLIIISILILLGILTLFKQLAYVSGFLLSLISIKFLIKSSVALISPEFNNKVSNKVWTLIEKIQLEVSLSKLIYYSASVVVFFLWIMYFNNFLLTDLIAFSITYLVVKKFNFRNFYFILFLFSFVILYNLIWVILNEIEYEDIFNLTSGNFINIPVRFSLPEVIKSPFDTYYFFSILDLILIGFLVEYLKTSSENLDTRYLKYGHCGLIMGLTINLICFYVFKKSFPFFIFPGIIMIITVMGFSIWNQEFLVFNHLDKQEKYSQKKIIKEFPLKIIGADQSEDFNEMVNLRKYKPPTIINEIEGIREESPGAYSNILNVKELNKL